MEVLDQMKSYGNWRPWLLAGVTGLIIMQVVALSPAKLEQSGGAPMAPETVLEAPKNEKTLATAVPAGVMPEYTVDKFSFVSVKGDEKQWKIQAKKAYLFHKQNLTHGRDVTAYLYDAEGKITLVVGDEAQYFTNTRNLEVFGHVKSTSPDGFVTTSEYMAYNPATRVVSVPDNYDVHGIGTQDKGQVIRFESGGLNFKMGASEIVLPTRSTVSVTNPPTEQRPAEETRIVSDACKIDRNLHVAFFTMKENRPDKERFVHMYQPTLFARSRRSELHYGDSSQRLQSLTAYDDVFIQETGEQARMTLDFGH